MYKTEYSEEEQTAGMTCHDIDKPMFDAFTIQDGMILHFMDRLRDKAAKHFGREGKICVSKEGWAANIELTLKVMPDRVIVTDEFRANNPCRDDAMYRENEVIHMGLSGLEYVISYCYHPANQPAVQRHLENIFSDVYGAEAKIYTHTSVESKCVTHKVVFELSVTGSGTCMR